MAEKSTRQVKTPEERAREAADLAARKHKRVADRLAKVTEEQAALAHEEEVLAAEAKFLAAHPLLTKGDPKKDADPEDAGLL